MVKDREAWHAAVHEVTESWTQLSDIHTTTYNIQKHTTYNIQQQSTEYHSLALSALNVLRTLTLAYSWANGMAVCLQNDFKYISHL